MCTYEFDCHNKELFGIGSERSQKGSKVIEVCLHLIHLSVLFNCPIKISIHVYKEIKARERSRERQRDRERITQYMPEILLLS